MMFKKYLSSLIVISLCLTTSCVSRNPSHKLPKIIDNDVFINKDEKLCFKPDFSTATVNSERHELDEIIRVSFTLHRFEKDDYVLILHNKLPEDKKYHGLPICLEEKINTLLATNNKYVLNMVGIDPKNFFNVRSGSAFIYEEDHTIRIESKISE